MKPTLHATRLAKLLKRGPLNNLSDDPEWLDLLSSVSSVDFESSAEELGDALIESTLRTYHGCRVVDAGVFHREGLRLNDPNILAEQVRRLVHEDDRLAWLRPDIEERISNFDSRERDTGRLYVCADDRPQLDNIGLLPVLRTPS
ncbi:hypothetical protein [Devosia sp.]|uniref:hypothetical protein n=1 Tax=Devosia sp. TaxID=1871048 RepID=UPI002733B846|nr:hypothetical protein [Devosia sp.]MDP2778882.1 hypothetical protein [Devosia sp.]